MTTKIYVCNTWKDIKPENSPKNMREVTSFANFNLLKHLVKLQGGYYIINKNKEFEFLGRTLSSFSFLDYYNKSQ